MPAVRLTLLVLAAVVVGSSSAAAQAELYVFRSSGYGFGGIGKLNDAVLFAIDLDAPARLVASHDIQEIASGPIVTADGRYVILSARRGPTDLPFILVWDSRTSTRFEFAVPGFGGGVMAADHHRVRAFVTDPANKRLLVVEPTGITSITLTGTPEHLAMSVDGRDLYVLQPASADSLVTIVSTFNLAQRTITVTARLLRVMPTLPGEFVATSIAPSSSYQLTRHDSLTGAALQTWEAPLTIAIGLHHFDVATRQVVVNESEFFVSGHIGLRLFNAENLVVTRTIPSARRGVTMSAIVADPRLNQYYLVGQGGGYYRFPCGTAFIDRLDANYNYVDGVDLPGYGCAGATLAPHPPPPKDLSATVAASRVTLEWTGGDSAPGVANNWRVEAFAGNQLVASILTGRETPGFSVNGVPTGTYRVSVTGVNDAGIGERSDEIVIVVP